ncbi:MAG: hypothetical protein R6W31_09335 [Bacteroidales bacterium]
MFFRLRSIIIIGLLVRSTLFFGQSIDLFGGYSINRLFDFGKDGHIESEYLINPGYIIGIGIEDIKIDWLNLRFTLAYHNYSGEVLEKYSGLASGSTTNVQFAKSTISLGGGTLAGVIQSVPTAVSGGLAIYLFGVIGMQGIALMMSHKVNLFDPKQLAIGAVIMVVGIGGHIGFPGGFLPIPLMANLFPNGWPAIATGAVAGIVLNTIFLVFKPPVRGAIEPETVLEAAAAD